MASDVTVIFSCTRVKLVRMKMPVEVRRRVKLATDHEITLTQSRGGGKHLCVALKCRKRQRRVKNRVAIAQPTDLNSEIRGLRQFTGWCSQRGRLTDLLRRDTRR